MTTRAWILFVLISVIWGVPYLFIKIAVDGGIPPAFVAWARVALAAVLLLPLALHRSALRGVLSRGWAVVAYTACEIAVPFVLIAAGEQYISSSLAAILVATMPLMVALMTLRLSPADRPSCRRLIGLVIGLTGVIVLLGIDVGGRLEELLGAAFILLATLGYAAASIIVSRHLADLEPLGPVAASLTLATIVLLPAAFLTQPNILPALPAILSIAILGFICTALGLIVFFRLIAEAGPSRASVITYVNPLVAVIIGVLVLGEHLGPTSIAGLLLILGGSWLSTGGRPSAEV